MRVLVIGTILLMITIAIMNIIHFKTHYDKRMAAQEPEVVVREIIECDLDRKFPACYKKAKYECEKDMGTFAECYKTLSSCSITADQDVEKFTRCLNKGLKG